MDTFKVLSFNIHHNNVKDPQTIMERAPLIRQIIIDNQPDIFGVQEFSNSVFKSWFLAEMTTLGYGNTHTESVTISPKTIFYRISKFNLIDSALFLLGGGSGMWAILEHKISLNRYFICNSHWAAGGAAQPTRIQNSANLIDTIRRHFQGLPVITFGDFNARPATTEIMMLKDSLDVVDALGDTQGAPTFHHWNATGTSKLDWMMSTRDMAFLSSKVITTSYGGYWPSDHWPVMATYLSPIFEPEHTDNFGASSISNSNYYFADIDGDGRADKIHWRSNYNSGIPRVFLSNGDGNFSNSPIGHPAGAATSGSTRFYFADVDGDGMADEIQWDPTLHSGRTRIYLATGSGQFSASAVDNPEGTSTGTATVYHFADVNGDGKADKIYWHKNFDNGHTRVYLATSAGSFTSTVVSDAAGASTTAETRFYYSDVNNDGKADKILWHPDLNGGKPLVYISEGDGTFTESPTLSVSGAGSVANSTRFYFADINGDGMADKIYWHPTNYLGKIKVYFCDGTHFKGPIYSLYGNSQSVHTAFYFADIDGDGKQDQIRWDYSQFGGSLKNYFGR